MQNSRMSKCYQHYKNLIQQVTLYAKSFICLHTQLGKKSNGPDLSE